MVVDYKSELHTCDNFDGPDVLYIFCYLFFLTDADKSQQGFKADERSIRVIGFVPKEKIPKNKILGDGNMVFFPTEGDVVSTREHLQILML